MDALLLTAAILLGLVALVVAAELLTRLCLRRFGRYYVWEPHSRTVMPLDPAVFPTGDALVHFSVNALGERGAPLPADLSRTFRILVGGGSAAECFFLDQHSSWPEALGRALSTPPNLSRLQRSSVHVGNVARSLTDCRALNLLFSRILPRYPRSDVTLLMTGASDLVRWLEEHTPATITDTPIPPSSVFARHPEGPFGWTPSKLALRRVATALKHSLLRPLERRETAGKRLAANRASRANATRILTSIADPAPMLAHYERHLRTLVPLLQHHSSRVILLRQPWLERPFTPSESRLLWMFGDGRPYHELVSSYYDRALIYPILRQLDAITTNVAHDLHATSLDLRSRIPADFEHYYDEMHNTPKGCALVGALVAEAILSSSPPRPSAPSPAR
jgi:hypothetical protein